MATRTRARTRKTSAGVRAMRIPGQRRGSRRAPMVLVVPEHPGLAARAAAAAAGWVWEHRYGWAPTGLALATFLATAVLHAVMWPLAFPLGLATAAPGVWLLFVTRRRPPNELSVHRWRQALAALATVAAVWVVLAVAFGPTAGPLAMAWLLLAVAVQGLWSYTRYTTSRKETR